MIQARKEKGVFFAFYRKKQKLGINYLRPMGGTCKPKSSNGLRLILTGAQL
jgi:hypothetical protein